jgi:hypothetical protein
MEHSVKTVSKFVEWVTDEVTSDSWYGEEDVFGPWFRGQGDARWRLRPKLYREAYFYTDSFERKLVEDEAREEFMVRAPALSDAVPRGEDRWGWYFLMQHFGAPTRLLDWTEGALIALYFAVKDNTGEGDAMVWALDPYELNRLVIEREEVFPVGSLAAKVEDRKLVDPWLDPATAPASPIAVNPVHTSRRISTQRSCFTVFGADREGLRKFHHGKDGCLRNVRIPKSCVAKIRCDLETCGIDETTVFPDLEGLGRTVSARWVK